MSISSKQWYCRFEWLRIGKTPPIFTRPAVFSYLAAGSVQSVAAGAKCLIPPASFPGARTHVLLVSLARGSSQFDVGRRQFPRRLASSFIMQIPRNKCAAHAARLERITALVTVRPLGNSASFRRVIQIYALLYFG